MYLIADFGEPGVYRFVCVLTHNQEKYLEIQRKVVGKFIPKLFQEHIRNFVTCVYMIVSIQLFVGKVVFIPQYLSNQFYDIPPNSE